MHLDQTVSLKSHHTFGMEVEARYFVEAKTHTEVLTLLNYRKMIHMPILFLGGGSNILFTGNFRGIVIKINSKGIEIKEEDEGQVLVTAEAGENWDEFVQYCVSRGWAGLENLSLIPGKVGAAPIQNIGAYGVEVKDVIDSVLVAEIDSGKQKRYHNADCQFGYRDSIFKRALKGKVIILSVTFRLKKVQFDKVSEMQADKETGLQVDKITELPDQGETSLDGNGEMESYSLRLDYGDIKGELARMEVTDPTIREVREAICHIRRRKLPDPDQIGNAGSFFKNPVVEKGFLQILLERFPAMPFFPQYTEKNKVPADFSGLRDNDKLHQTKSPVQSTVADESRDNDKLHQAKSPGQSTDVDESRVFEDAKIPAAWLIEQCGWKGYRNGDAGVHPNQPLVLVNYGAANGQQILELANQIMDSVEKKFGIRLETEVNIIGS